MNLQFVWMVAIGALGFGEVPAAGTWLGVAIVIGSGLFLVWDQFAPQGTPRAGLRLRTDP
jgi:drug/metabolite transporter (DMT)-like permease